MYEYIFKEVYREGGPIRPWPYVLRGLVENRLRVKGEFDNAENRVSTFFAVKTARSCTKFSCYLSKNHTCTEVRRAEGEKGKIPMGPACLRGPANSGLLNFFKKFNFFLSLFFNDLFTRHLYLSW